MKLFRDLFTGRDNQTYDIGRILWFQAVQAFIGISIYSLYKGGMFDPVTWGAGLAALLGGGGAAIAMKSTTEPADLNGDGYVDAIEKAVARSQRAKALKQQSDPSEN